ncbi:MAG: ABC transporter permease subunit [Gammaproteobacteria bacterium]|nr:ABC transporter permease subunit [Gammaproteobacteria bacterium]
MPNKTYYKNEAITWPTPNYWDVIALGIILGFIVLLAWGARQMALPYDLGQPLPISLDPANLPGYALRTVLRMFIALFCSLLFTFTFGTLAAKSKRAERILVPLIDVMQSAPVLSFLSLTVAGFIVFFKGSMLGPECAAIFAIFTSQVWNMTLSFYQSLSSVPKDLHEVATIFQLSAWRRFWRIEVPFAMPGLLWNMMMSMSGSWFFVTASEAFSVANQNITLPGVGSYIAMAIVHADKAAIIYAIITMLLVILLYDQFLFRPLVNWADKFKSEEVLDERGARSWVVTLLQRTRLLNRLGTLIVVIFDSFVNFPLFNPKRTIYKQPSSKHVLTQRLLRLTTDLIISAIILFTFFMIFRFLRHAITLADIKHTLWLGLLTGLRVIILIFICSLIWVPVGVWIGFRPRVAEIVQPIIQVLAAFPANLLFPLAAYLLVRYKLNINIWASPLMVLGTQWYILFNVIAGASTMPQDLRLATASFGVKGLLKWRRLILPGIFPFFVTGAITAAGGAWNASIIAEVINWGNIKLTAAGLGAYITQYANAGNFPHIALGTITMCVLVLIINRILWRPLYNMAIERFKIE